jgi:hypothetical protein
MPKEIEQDVLACKLDKLANEAIAEPKARSSPEASIKGKSLPRT